MGDGRHLLSEYRNGVTSSDGHTWPGLDLTRTKAAIENQRRSCNTSRIKLYPGTKTKDPLPIDATSEQAQIHKKDMAIAEARPSPGEMRG